MHKTYTTPVGSSNMMGLLNIAVLSFINTDVKANGVTNSLNPRELIFLSSINLHRVLLQCNGETMSA